MSRPPFRCHRARAAVVLLVTGGLVLLGCESGGEDPPVDVCTPTISGTTTPPSGTVGLPYDYSLAVDCDCDDATWQVVAGTFVQGLTLVDGRISGTPTQSNIYNFTVAYDSNCREVGDAQLALRIVIGPAPTCPPLTLAASLRAGVIDTPYSSEVMLDGINGLETGEGTLTFSVVSGALPPGLGIDDASHALTGTPTAEGTFDFRLRVTDSCPALSGGTQEDEHDYSLVIGAGCEAMVLVGRNFIGSVGTPYHRELVTSGGVTPIFAQKVAGTLPPGIGVLNDPPRLSGTPTDAATYAFTLEFTDSCLPPQKVQKEFSFIVNPF